MKKDILLLLLLMIMGSINFYFHPTSISNLIVFFFNGLYAGAVIIDFIDDLID